MNDSCDILIVGAGLSGATIAEHFARVLNRSVRIIDQRDHIAGNVYDFVDPKTGIRVGKYGIHMFHTNDDRVWTYVNRFGSWKRWDHKVLSKVGDQFVPVPVNINTINMICNETLQKDSDMMEWLRKNQVPCETPQSSKDVARARVGDALYEALFRPYTLKQWNKDPSELDPSVLARIPVRTSFDDRYFEDKYQALPVNGYTALVASMLDHPNIDVRLNTSWTSIKDTVTWNTLIFTGPIDHYFQEFGLPPLEYRSLEFEWETHKTRGYYQPVAQVNYPDPSVPYTRIVEYKHLLNQPSEYTIITKETSNASGEPYYPVPTAKNQETYELYRRLADEKRSENVHFIGRLARYKYFNMDQAIAAAMDYFYTVFSKNGIDCRPL
jgi:UDP-galactopyranose mutase